MPLRARAPTRIDLSGGTLDLWPLFLLVQPAATVNLAIDRYTSVTVEPSADDRWHVQRRDSEADADRGIAADTPEELFEAKGAEIAGALIRFFRPERPLRLTTHSEAPPQAGLGASSSLGIAISGVLNALTGFRYAAEDLIAIVRDAEVEVLRTITGAQDHYPPVYGGANCLWWGKVSHRREALPVDSGAFEKRFLLAYSHQPHRSGATNWEVVKRFLDGDPEARTALEKSGRTAVLVRDAIADGDLDRVAELVGEDWDARRAMAPAVSSPELETIIESAREAGAISGKACGAGGGGCIVFGIPEGKGKRDEVAHAIERAGGSILDYHLVDSGLELAIDD
jgi:D-glycero-alpha-D-manno-heptose-7-phosphate kinase